MFKVITANRTAI